MIDRREILKLGTGSIFEMQSASLMARTVAGADALDRIVVVNDDYVEGRTFAREASTAGSEVIAITGTIEPRRRNELNRRLRTKPAIIVGLTTEENAFQLGMAASDAFHHQLTRESYTVETHCGDLLAAWAIGPVSELRA
ncbi:hypothetical protein [Candidatus Rariloculus sp.]|uniref:hypothetical protein n=1 Tax=Candidatus Rariloculus sp. TaxID=3101265 RepID=UPI003D0DD51C